MNKNKFYLPAAAFFTALVVSIYMRPQPLSAGQSENRSAKTPVASESKTSLLGSKRPILVDFWASWCEPCRISGPIVDRMEKTFKKDLKVVRVEADKNSELSKAFNVQYLPTLLLIQNGKVVQKWEGTISEKNLKAGIEKTLVMEKPST